VKASLGTEEEAEKEAEKKKREDGSRGPSFVRLRGSTTAFDLLSELHFRAFCFVLQRYLSLSLSLSDSPCVWRCCAHYCVSGVAGGFFVSFHLLDVLGEACQ
jgi:hypothetical protein